MKKPTIDSFIVEEGLENVSGDIGFIHEHGQEIFIGLIDGSGHGPEARRIAQTCRQYLEDNMGMELVSLMKGLHDLNRGSRGCVAIIASLDLDNLQLNYVGVGNICMRKFGNSHERSLLGEGIVGYSISTPKEKLMQLQNGDVLVFHSDGIKSHFGINDYPEILKDDAKTIAINIVRKFGKNDDDATCIVLRCSQGYM